jgi:hypothetical protein
VTSELSSLLTTEQVAELLVVSEDFVREHAAELGGIRMGHGQRSPLRFESARIEEWKERHRLEAPEPPKARKPHRPGLRAAPPGIELLPLPSSH